MKLQYHGPRTVIWRALWWMSSLLPDSQKGTGKAGKLLNFTWAKPVLPAGRQQRAFWIPQKCLRKRWTTTLCVLGSCLRKLFMRTSEVSPGLRMKHPSAPFNNMSVLVPFNAAIRTTDSCKRKTNLSTFLGWLNVRPISQPAPSPLKFIFLYDLLLLLGFVQLSHHSNKYLLISHYF